MGCHLIQAEFKLGNLSLVDASSVAVRGLIGAGLGHAGQKRGLKLRGLFAKKLLRQLEHACSVGNDLHSLNARDVIEEPAATGVHELSVALHLH